MKNFFKKIGKAIGKALSVIGKIGVYVGMVANFVLPGIGTLISAASSLAAQIGTALQHGIQNVGQFFKMLGNVALDAVGSIPGVGQAVQMAVKVGKAVRTGVRAIQSVVKQGLRGLGNALSTALNTAAGALGNIVPEAVTQWIGRAAGAIGSARNLGEAARDGQLMEAVVDEATTWAAREGGGGRMGNTASDALEYGLRAADSFTDVVAGLRSGEGMNAILDEAGEWVRSEVGRHGAVDERASEALRDGIAYASRAAGSIGDIAAGVRAGDGLEAMVREADEWLDAELGQHGVLGTGAQERIAEVADYGGRAASTVASIARGVSDNTAFEVIAGEAGEWFDAEWGTHGLVGDDVRDAVESAANYGRRLRESVEHVADSSRHGRGFSAVMGEADQWFRSEFGEHEVLSRSAQEWLDERLPPEVR
jgi:plasmid stabilization system protein ParE